MSVETLFFVKFVISISVVLLLSYLAEKFSAKWAGIISGLPTGSAITLYFYAYENGLEFASESALYNMIGLVAMQAFIAGYYITSKFIKQPSILSSTLFGVIFYLIAAFIISCSQVTLSLALLVSPASFIFFITLFSGIESLDIKKNVPLTIRILLIRSLISGSIIVFITTIAYMIGAKWSGIFSAFPTTLFPLILIIHLTYGKKYSDTVIKFVPHGLGGLFLYSLIIHLSYKSTGLNIGVIMAFAGTACYMLGFSLLKKLFAIFNKPKQQKHK